VKAQEVHIKYRSTWITVIVSMVVASIASIVLRFVLISMNKKREAAGTADPSPEAVQAAREDDEKTVTAQTHGSGAVEGEAPLVIDKVEEYVDLTDKQAPFFRYTL
jgi:flagellar basal body-associated protein FliL